MSFSMGRVVPRPAGRVERLELTVWQNDQGSDPHSVGGLHDRSCERGAAAIMAFGIALLLSVGAGLLALRGV
ncbi:MULTISPECIES: hypothetical protein [unclassified Sphingomonas]|uniref:hypothetical protein n=1 Tax=unclassified Sphingomonas TaxID=196159 RepID=UPI00138ED738|nr:MULTISPECIES: hypothetical protein [unclassified Sphingomonas]